jgi:dihydroorotate dehydrogenase electron transfer subunit
MTDSKGHQGIITGILDEYTRVSPVDYLYACGPEVMLAEVEKVCLQRGIAGELSLEAYMGCGVGACLWLCL